MASVLYTDKGRVVNTGSLSKGEIHAILTKLNDLGFFSSGEKDSLSTAGTYFDLQVKLSSKLFHHYWNSQTAPFDTVEQSLLFSPNVKSYVPGKGLMVAKPYSLSQSTEVIPQWPQQYGFSLAEVAEQSRLISDSAAQFVWDVINKNPDTPMISDKGQTYLVDLEETNISTFNSDYSCWNP